MSYTRKYCLQCNLFGNVIHIMSTEVNTDIILDEYCRVIALFSNHFIQNACLRVDLLSLFLNNLTSTWKHNSIHPLRM